MAGSTCSGCLTKTQTWCRKNLLLLLTVSGVFMGVVLGLCLPLVEPSDDVILLVSFPGEIFMRALMMIMVPLVVTSIVSGISKFTPGSLGKLGFRVLVFYISTTVVATILGIVFALAIRPGSKSEEHVEEDVHLIASSKSLDSLDAFLDAIRNLFPENLFEASFRSQRTTYQAAPGKQKDDSGQIVVSNSSLENRTEENKSRKLEYQNGTNTLGIISFTIVVSIIMTKLKTRPEMTIKIFCEMNDVIMKLVHLIMWCSPVGIMSLVAGRLMTVSDLATVSKQLVIFTATTTGGVITHTLVIYSALYVVFTRKNPILFIRGMSQACLTAFALSSSAATIPATLECLEDNLGIDRRVTRFTVPIGATVNMDATALNTAVSTLFIAQLHDISLDAGQIVTICATSVLASIGAAAVPGSGIVMLIMVLESAGFPVENVSLLLTVDWLTGRFRTVTNILGDSFGAAIVAHLCRHDLVQMEERVDDKQEQLVPLTDMYPNSRTEAQEVV